MTRLRYTIRRLLSLIPVMLAVVTLAFFIMRAAPGGPFDRDKVLPPDIEQNIRAKYRLDEPLHTQYLHYMGSVLRGDLGPSFKYQNRTVNEIILSSFPVSLKLGLFSVCIALVVGITVGTIAGLRPRSWKDHTLMTVGLFGISIPNIVLGPLLVLVFGLWLRWLPVAGWGTFADYVLPSLTLSAIYIAYIARMTRTGVLEVSRQEYVTAARAKGLSESRVVLRHVLPGGVLPVVSYLGPACASVLTGSIVVEKIFQIPGLGQHFVQAALNRDYTLAMGTVIFYAFLLMLLNLMVDLIYTFIDPRIRHD